MNWFYFACGWFCGGVALWGWWEWTIHWAVSEEPDDKVSKMSVLLRKKFIRAIEKNVYGKEQP